MSSRFCQQLYVLLASCILLVPAGCANLTGLGSLALFSAGDEESQVTGNCLVEFRHGNRTGKRIELPVHADMRLQDALKASKAISKFRKMDVAIYRQVPDHPQGSVKLACNYDHREKSVTWDTDYAILPGDLIVVREDHTTLVDEVVDSLVGPIFSQK